LFYVFIYCVLEQHLESIMAKACNSFNRAFMKLLRNGEYFIFVCKLPFKGRMLIAMKVAPSELHHNNRALLKAFSVSVTTPNK